MWVSANLYVHHVCAGVLKGQKRVQDPLELELQAVVSRLMWGLRAEPQSFARAAPLPFQHCPLRTCSGITHCVPLLYLRAKIPILFPSISSRDWDIPSPSLMELWSTSARWRRMLVWMGDLDYLLLERETWLLCKCCYLASVWLMPGRHTLPELASEGPWEFLLPMQSLPVHS